MTQHYVTLIYEHTKQQCFLKSKIQCHILLLCASFQINLLSSLMWRRGFWQKFTDGS